MSSTVRQQREAARAKLEARMAEKAIAAKRRRRIQVTLASVLAVVLVGGIGFLLYKVVDSANTGEPTADGSSNAPEEEMIPTGDGSPVTDVNVAELSMSAAPDVKDGSAECTFTASPAEELQSNVNLQDVGLPEAEQPNTGTQMMTMETSEGKLIAELDNSKAPCSVGNLNFLANQAFFNGSKCHRLTTEGIFVLQCGDPSGTGMGGPAYGFANENLPEDTAAELSEEDKAAGKTPEPNYPAGTIAMAHSTMPDSNGSQFFIVYEDTYLPADYTIMGQLTEGLDVVREIAKAGAEKPASGQPTP